MFSHWKLYVLMTRFASANRMIFSLVRALNFLHYNLHSNLKIINTNQDQKYVIRGYFFCLIQTEDEMSNNLQENIPLSI